ncbi:MAG TPA: sigma factor-like helix-turn-helix DNA-binding protein [Terriglobales bacterium]|nr:sigma factor-like helix-turn-helix DNA-binding protein [Terriglobales bacterium]
MSALPTAVLTLEARATDEELEIGRDPDLWLYREKTVGLLRRFLRLSLDTGRVPSLLGREFFRSKVSHRRMFTFEDSVIFVHDVERCLESLDEYSRQLIARIALQEYTHEEAAEIMHCCSKTIQRYYPEALDKLSEIFLVVGLLQPLVCARKNLSSPRASEKVQ